MACNSMCKYFSYVTSVTTSSDSIILNLNNTPTFVNGNNFCFRFNPNIAIPTGASNYNVFVQIGTSQYPLCNKYGNTMIGSDLLSTTTGATYCPRFTYHSYFGEQTTGETTTSFIIVHNIPRASCTVYFQ